MKPLDPVYVCPHCGGNCPLTSPRLEYKGTPIIVCNKAPENKILFYDTEHMKPLKEIGETMYRSNQTDDFYDSCWFDEASKDEIKATEEVVVLSLSQRRELVRAVIYEVLSRYESNLEFIANEFIEDQGL